MRRLLLLFMAMTMTACGIPNGFKEHGDFVRNHLLKDPNVSEQYIRHDGFQLHYRQTGNAQKAVVVWVHGTPGNWTDGAYLYRDKTFISGVKLVLLDRPGWGESQYLDQPRLITSFKEIGRLIQPLLHKLKQDHPDVPLILLGFSWGGSVAPAIALDYPELIDGVLLLSGGLDPELTRPRWYNKFANTLLGNAVIGESLRQANIEMYALSPQLAMLRDRLPHLPQPVIVVQGDRDKLVDPKNADYAEQVLPEERSLILRLENQGHLLQLERTGLIARCVVALANNDFNICS